MEFGNYGYSDEMTGAGWQTPRIGWESEIPQRHWHQNDSAVGVNGLTGATNVLNVFTNDTLNGVAVVPAQVTLTQQPGGDPELTEREGLSPTT